MRPGWLGSHLRASGGQDELGQGCRSNAPGPGAAAEPGSGGGRQRSGLQARDVSVAMETPASISTCGSCRRPLGREGSRGGGKQKRAGPHRPAVLPLSRAPERAGVPVPEGTLQLSYPAGGQAPRHAPFLQSERCLGMKQLRLWPFPTAAAKEGGGGGDCVWCPGAA